MSVLAFRPRSAHGPARPFADHPAMSGTFVSPRGRSGRMVGVLRVQRLVMGPRGAFVTGVFTGELRDDDGTLVGVDSRRATATTDLVADDHAFRPWVRPFALDLMGISVEVRAFPVDPVLAFARPDPLAGRPGTARGHPDVGPVP